MIAAILSLLSIPVVLLNFAGGIVGGIWLAILGKWGLIGLGVASMFISPSVLGLILMPGLIFLAPAALALSRGKYMIGTFCLLIGNLWTLIIVTIWCVGCFYFATQYYESGSKWPYLLWGYGMATGPWTYMASRGGSDEIGSTFCAFGACIGAIAIMGILLFEKNPTTFDAAIVFSIPMLVVLILMVVSGFLMGKQQKMENADSM